MSYRDDDSWHAMRPTDCRCELSGARASGHLPTRGLAGYSYLATAYVPLVLVDCAHEKLCSRYPTERLGRSPNTHTREFGSNFIIVTKAVALERHKHELLRLLGIRLIKTISSTLVFLLEASIGCCQRAREMLASEAGPS